MESYRRRQNDCQPRFDQAFGGLCEQNMQDTFALKQRFLETKAKRQNKTKQDKQNKHQQQQNDATNAALQSSVHVQQKFLKRSNDDMDNVVNTPDGLEPPVKLQCTTQHNQAHSGHPGGEGLTKFSVEIVQQLEFTTSAANSQPQQISTNVTVKALTNASVKSDVASPKSSNPSTPLSNTMRPNSNIGCVDIGTLVECKQEPDNDFADLDQCAAALEKDAQANGGNSFPGFSDLIGDDTSDEIITSDAFKDLISEISDLNPEFMKDFDFEDKSDIINSTVNSSLPNLPPNGLKVEDTKDFNTALSQSAPPQNPQQPPQQLLDVTKSTHSPLLQNAYSPPIYEGQGLNKASRMPPYANMDFVKTELSPAAQTLKQMAEQHQHKNQMGLSGFNPTSGRVPNSRSPYTDFQFGSNEFLNSPNSNNQNVAAYHNKSNSFPQPDLIKQELNMYNNQPKGGNGPAAGPGMYKQQYSPYGSPSANHGSPGYMPRGGPGGPQNGPPPRPPSGPGGNPQGGPTTLQINQAQQLHISQPGHGIQVSAGQHLHLSGDMKGGVSVAAQQGMYFNQQQNQAHNTSHQSQQTPNSNHHGSGSVGASSNAPPPPQHQQQSNLHAQQSQHHQQQQQNGPPTMTQHTMVQSQQMQQQGDTYTVSQSQTINFTQQSLRQRAAAQAAANSPNGATMNQMGRCAGGQTGPVQVSMPNHEHAKMMQQQQLMQAQRAAMQQHMGGVRPPPPDYKASAALIHGGSGQQRFPNAVPPNAMRRMNQQPIPPSGPMMRPQQQNMYNMVGSQQQQQQVQQQMAARNAVYPRTQGPMGGMPGVEMNAQHAGGDWRHLMSQQQSASYNNPNQMRSNFQHQGFNMANQQNMQQMTAMQQQQMRLQGGMSGHGGHNMMNPSGGMPNNPNMMNQMSNPGMMNQQQMMAHAQHQAMMQQQGIPPTQMSNMLMSPQGQGGMCSNGLHQQQGNPQNNAVNNNANTALCNANNSQQHQNNSLNNFSQSAPDFNLDFLENLPAGDTSNFSAADLLNSLDNGTFNLQDIL